jgi:hypothetical protein
LAIELMVVGAFFRLVSRQVIRSLRLIAWCAKDYAQGRKLVEQGARLSPAVLADTSVSLKDAGADHSAAALSLTNAAS